MSDASTVDLALKIRLHALRMTSSGGSSHIGAVFVKDCVWENGKIKNVPLGEGMVDKKFFAMLKESKFTGPISVHVEYLDRSKDKKALGDAFRKDLAALKALL